MLIPFAALAAVALALAGDEHETEVSEFEYRSDGVRCRLTWTGPATGWRLQTATADGAFADAGAVQRLAAFMDEKMPSAAQAFRLAEKDGVRLCRAADGTSVTVDGAGWLDVRSASGKLVTERIRVSAAAGKAVLAGRLLDDEAVYGLGERLDRFNKRGQRVALYTSDGYNDSSATYMAIPLFTTPRGGGVFVNLYERMVADFGAAETNVWRFEADRPNLDAYLFAKERIPAAIEAYTALSGHADEPEDWNRGPLICRYYPDLTRLDGPFVCEFRGMTLRGHGLREMMERHISLGVKPTAVIVEGGGYADLFSKPEKREEFGRMAAYLREKDIKLMIYMRMGSVCSKAAPGFRPGFNVSVALATNGVPAVADTKMIPDRYSKGINPDVGKAKAHEAADITDPAFWDWYVNTVWKDLVEAGVRGVKIDFCEELPEEGANPGGVGVHYKWKDPSVFAGTSVHHAYPTFFISRFYRELSRLTKGCGGFMVLSRGGGIGSQRNPYLWAGDQQRLFEKLDDQLLALLNSGMSGVPFMTYDLAGYQYNGLCAEPDGKIGDTPVVVRRGRKTDAGTEAAIFRRGVEFSAFTTCVQSHGFVRNAYDFDVATREHYRKYMTIHASLSNLIAKVCREASERGVPPVRPLVWAYPDDPKTWDVADEFLLGDALLVAPSFGRGSRRDVYLPAGDWERLEGLEIPVYVNRRSSEAKDLDAFRRAAGSPVRDYAADPAFVVRYRDAALALAKRKSAALGSDLRAKVPVGPRIATGGKFKGHYLWDVGFSVFWAVHAGRGEMPIASSLDNLYRFAEPDGYIGREFHPDGTPTWNPMHPISFNPPMLSWAELELADGACAEEGRLVRVYEPLVRHHRVCVRRWRRPDGLYFGCGLGCGMDDLPRWPKGYAPAQRMEGGMILTEDSLNPRARDMWKRWLHAQQADHSWNRQAGWIDMSAAMALDARSLAEIARRLGKTEDAAAFAREYETLAETINRLCWDEKTGFYYDVTDKGPVLRRHLGALWALTARVATPERARRMAKTLFDPEVFYRPVPLASLEKGDPDYETERLYWRGPAWPNLNFLAIRGLLDYGMRDEAERLARRWYNCCADLFVRTGGVYENVCSEQLDHVKERAFPDYAGHGCLTPIALPALFGWGNAVAASPVAASTDAERRGSGMMNAVCPSRAEGGTGGVRVVFLGNSITLHAPAPKIGWTNDWGMAASAREKDYVHLVARAIGERTGRPVDLRIRNLADFERNYRTWDVEKGLADLVAFQPDYLVVALGENVPDLVRDADIVGFRKGFARILRCFTSGDRRPQAVVRGVFWPNPVKDEQMHRVAQDQGVPFVRTDVAGEPDMMATGLFVHQGVQNHPGDRGMAETAARIVAALFPSGDEARFPSTVLPVGVNFAGSPTQRNFSLLSQDFDVHVDGRTREVRAIRVSAHPFNRVWPGHQRPYGQTEPSAYVAFEKSGPAAFEVRPRGGCRTAVVRPLSAGVRPSVKDGVISFVLPTNGCYVVEVDGSHRTLHVFSEPPRDFAEYGKPTRSFGPGVHLAGVIDVRSGERIYIDRDAVVYGRIAGQDVSDVKVFGGGVLDGSTCERVFDSGYTPLQPYGIGFFRSRDITVDGPVLLNCAYWCTAFFDCENVDVAHLKVVGQWRYNTDGVDICNSRHVRVRDCFVRSFDDTICVKGVLPFADKPVEDVSVERCVLWCGWGNTCEIGVETHAPHMKGIRFSQCDLIHNAAIALDVGCGGKTVVDDVSYRDIRVEFQRDTEPMILQKRDGESWNPGGKRGNPSLAIVRATPYGKDGGGGKVGRVTYDGLRVYAESGVPEPFVRIAAGEEVRIPRIGGTMKVESQTRIFHADPETGRDLRFEMVRD